MLFYSVFLSPSFFFFLSLCPAAHSLCFALPNSSLNLSQTLFLSLALALALPLSSASAQAQSRTCTPTLIGSAQAQSMALSPVGLLGHELLGVLVNGKQRSWIGLLVPCCLGFVFGWLPWDSVAGFSPLSRPWLQTKWVVLGLDLPAWVWWLWVWVCRRGCGGYGWLSWLRRCEWVLGGCRG